MAARSTAAMMLAIALLSVAGNASAAGDDVPPGYVEGREHELRIRSVLDELPPAPKELSRSARRTSASAVATCDPAQVSALRRVATTERDDDDPAACVVLPDGGAARADRSFLGAALLTGSDFSTVTPRRVGKANKRSQVVLQLSPSGQRRWDAVAAQAGPAALAITLDGRVLDHSTVANDAESVRVDPPDIAIVGGKRGLPTADANALIDQLRDTRSEAAIELARTTGMTKLAREIYGESDPQIDDKDQLAEDCPQFSDDASLVFGCFDGQQLFVLRVDRPDLATLMPVTAAHEMLHAVYDRMTSAERRKIDRLVSDYLEATPDARTHELLTGYGELDDDERKNEAHSIVGTVETTLPRVLERHYADYFEDRQEVVGQYEQYQVVFDELEATLLRLEGEAAALESQLTALEGESNAAGAEAERLYNEIESLRTQGRVDESNHLVDAQNAAVNRANSLVDQYNALVDQYNAKVAELNAASLVGQQLYQSLTPIEA